MTMTGRSGANAMICSMPDSAMSISVRPELVEGLFFPGPVEGKDGPSTSSGQTGFGIQTTVSIAANIAEPPRSEETTSDLPSLMRISYAFFCLKKTTNIQHYDHKNH